MWVYMWCVLVRLQFIVCHSINNFAGDLNAFLKSSINAHRKLKSAIVVFILFCALSLKLKPFWVGEQRKGKGNEKRSHSSWTTATAFTTAFSCLCFAAGQS